MVEAITFQTIFQFLQTVSIMIGIVYYFIIVNNQRKNQKLTASYNTLDSYTTPEGYQLWLEVLRLEWTDVDDFFAKYADTESQAKWSSIFQLHDGTGFLWKKGLIDLDDLVSMIPGIHLLWVRYKPVVERWRLLMNSEQYTYWEELSEALEPLVNDNWGPYVRETYFPKP